MGKDNFNKRVPGPVLNILQTLRDNGWEAYLVGGAVRDLLLGREPHDWDVSTSARPEQVLHVFPHSLATGFNYGTITVLSGTMPVEVTTFRSESHYLEGRNPSQVRFGVTLEDDLNRRDFTINAVAYNPLNGEWADPFGARRELLRGRITIRAVGNARRRLAEDPLRMLRAISLAARLGGLDRPAPIARMTMAAITAASKEIGRVSPERVRDELVKMLTSHLPAACLRLLAETRLLAEILPELQGCRGVDQGRLWRRYDVFDHALAVVQAIDSTEVLRFSALLHDIEKPSCRAVEKRKPGRARQVHFYRHEVVGARTAREVLRRLRFSRDVIETVELLIGRHMFSYPRTEAGVRRLIRMVGTKHIRQLLELRRADIIGSAARDFPMALTWLEETVSEILNSRQPLTLKDLAVSGQDVMLALDLKPGPKVGRVLNYLLERVLEDPALNKREVLLNLLNLRGNIILEEALALISE